MVDEEEEENMDEEPEEPQEQPATTPHYLYVKTGVGTYTVVDRVFGSKSEAEAFAKEQFPKTKYKTMNEIEIKNYMQRQAEKEKIIGEMKGAGKKIGTAFMSASRDVARGQGMTRETMQPRIEKLWGVQRQPQAQPQQQPNININIGNQQQPPEPEVETEEYEEPREERYPGMRMQPPYQRRRLNIPMPEERRGRLNIPAPPEYRRGSLNVPPPPQMRRRINIPAGGGVFQGRGITPKPYPTKRVKVTQGAGVYDQRANIPPEPPIKRTRFDFSFPPKYQTPFGRPQYQQPYEEVEETTKKVKKYHKKKRR